MGGGCHWCTEAVFNSLKGVLKVEQGYISSFGENKTFSEGIIIHYNPAEISLHDLVNVHLHTHASTAAHSFREKYRSAIYSFDPEEINEVENILYALQKDFECPLITQPLSFRHFKASRESLWHYYEKHEKGPFCQRYIIPKLKLINAHFKELEQ